MKKLITANDVKKVAESGENTIYAEPGTIITPAAKDAAAEQDIRIVEEARQPLKPVGMAPTAGGVLKDGITPELLARIVREVMASLTGVKGAELIKQCDPSGLRLVKGKTVAYEKFDGGGPGDRIGTKEIFTPEESPNMSSGFMKIEKTNFSRNLRSEEIDYILEGTLEVTVNGTTYRGEAGDTFYLPKDTTVKFSAPGEVKAFFVTCPAGVKL